MQELDDFAVRRFLRARNLNVEKASVMLLKYVKWRKEAVPNGFISDSEVPNRIAQKNFFSQVELYIYIFFFCEEEKVELIRKLQIFL